MTALAGGPTLGRVRLLRPWPVGRFELAGAAGLLLVRTAPWAAAGLTALLVAMFPASAVDNNRDTRPTADVVIMAPRLSILALSKHVEDLRPRSRPLRRESGGIPAQGLVADPLSNTR